MTARLSASITAICCAGCRRVHSPELWHGHDAVDTRNATHSADHGSALGVVYDDFTCAQVGDEQPVQLWIKALVVPARCVARQLDIGDGGQSSLTSRRLSSR